MNYVAVKLNLHDDTLSYFKCYTDVAIGNFVCVENKDGFQVGKVKESHDTLDGTGIRPETVAREVVSVVDVKPYFNRNLSEMIDRIKVGVVNGILKDSDEMYRLSKLAENNSDLHDVDLLIRQAVNFKVKWKKWDE